MTKAQEMRILAAIYFSLGDYPLPTHPYTADGTCNSAATALGLPAKEWGPAVWLAVIRDERTLSGVLRAEEDMEEWTGRWLEKISTHRVAVHLMAMAEQASKG